jgi:hypothetical protein
MLCSRLCLQKVNNASEYAESRRNTDGKYVFYRGVHLYKNTMSFNDKFPDHVVSL